jgi:excisionase family DNA binding protein
LTNQNPIVKLKRSIKPPTPVFDRSNHVKRSFFTTFEISEICEVNPTTVQNWVKERKLKAYVTPGGHRRIRKEDLTAFMREFGMPIPRRLVDECPYILIVDDEPEVLGSLKAMIESADGGAEIATAVDGVEALLKIGERKPDLLILDIMIPAMNGLEVCRKLKSNPGTRDIKIVAITGVHDPNLRGRVLRAGADLFFQKPLNVAEFRAASLRLISLRAAS